jgi:hypothetical protein
MVDSFETWELKIKPGDKTPSRVPGSCRVHFVNKPHHIELKPGESDGYFQPIGRRQFRRERKYPGY